MSRNQFCKYMRFNRSRSAFLRPVGSKPAKLERPLCLSKNLYYKPKGESDERSAFLRPVGSKPAELERPLCYAKNLRIMEAMDKYYLEHPTAGVLTMVNMLFLLGFVVNPKRVRRLLRKINIHAIYPQKCLSGGGCAKYVHPYLLRGLEITRPNQVWSTDISYIPMKGGFMYLYAIIDVYSRFIVGWKLSNTLSANNCHELLEDCIRVWGTPEILNSDQGSQYTTKAWEELLAKYDIKISMDGRGRCKDNIWIGLPSNIHTPPMKCKIEVTPDSPKH